MSLNSVPPIGVMLTTAVVASVKNDHLRPRTTERDGDEA